MYNYCCVFCERSLAIFTSLDLKPLKASMGVTGNNPVTPDWMPVFPGRSKPENFRSTVCAHHTLVDRLWCSDPVETDCRGEGMVGAGFEFRALIKVGCRAPLCSAILLFIRGFNQQRCLKGSEALVWCLGLNIGLSFPLK